MSTSSKAIIWVLVIVVVVGGIWLWWSMGQKAAAPTVSQTGTGQAQNTAPTTAPTGTATNPAGTPGANGISASDNSNASLNQDLSNIDGQMSGMNSDTASINSGLNDQPVTQGQ